MNHHASGSGDSGSEDVLVTQFCSFISDKSFPCVGAKSAFNRSRIQFEVFDELGAMINTARLHAALKLFAACHAEPSLGPVSFVALFRGPVRSETDFHDRLWTQLQALHDFDVVDHPWAEGVSSDANAPEFSFSVASRAFFVVGMHPQASRLARRVPCPALAFNFHDQFEALRAAGRYEEIQNTIRRRDIAMQGNINPVLASFGESSEALQYSGRPSSIGDCPFKIRIA
jgi:FPC/CPF motif-containing protein YcgG